MRGKYLSCIDKRVTLCQALDCLWLYHLKFHDLMKQSGRIQSSHYSIIIFFKKKKRCCLFFHLTYLWRLLSSQPLFWKRRLWYDKQKLDLLISEPYCILFSKYCAVGNTLPSHFIKELGVNTMLSLFPLPVCSFFLI